MQALLSEHRRAQGNLHTKNVESDTRQEEQAYDRDDSVEVAKSPNSTDCLDGGDEDGAAATTALEDKTTAKTGKDLQRHELHGSNSPPHSSLYSKQQASGNQGPRNTSQVAHQISQGQVKKTGRCSINMGEISFLGVYEQRETLQGPEYRCLVEMWFGPQDGIPQEQIQEYDSEMAQSRRRQSLRKREHDSHSEDTDVRMVKKIRRWKAYSQ